MNDSLHTKYRPADFESVVGQQQVVSSLEKVISRRKSHAFLFSGPSGCGKTTLARICAANVGCAPRDLLEIDAATHTGVDDMRAVADSLKYKPLGKGSVKAVIVDECHALSKNAWQSVLKIVEEPPEHVFWFFCTTEPGRVLPTIKTRCTSYTLKEVTDSDLTRLVKRVMKREKMNLGDDVVRVVVSKAKGSPRQVLVNLEQCAGVKNRAEAATVLEEALESEEVIQLCRFLMQGGSWRKAMTIVEGLKDTNPESIRIVVMNYMSQVALNAKNDQGATHALTLMEAFSEPYNASEKLAPLLLSIGRVIYDPAE